MSPSERPRRCSRITYSATISSLRVRWKRNANGDLRTSKARATTRFYAPSPEGRSYTRQREDGSLRRRLREADPRRPRRHRSGGEDRRLDRAPARRALGRGSHREPAPARGARAARPGLRLRRLRARRRARGGEHDARGRRRRLRGRRLRGQGQPVPPRGAARAARATVLRPVGRTDLSWGNLPVPPKTLSTAPRAAHGPLRGRPVELGVGDRIPVRVVRREAERAVDALLELLR